MDPACTILHTSSTHPAWILHARVHAMQAVERAKEELRQKRIAAADGASSGQNFLDDGASVWDGLSPKEINAFLLENAEDLRQRKRSAMVEDDPYEVRLGAMVEDDPYEVRLGAACLAYLVPAQVRSVCPRTHAAAVQGGVQAGCRGACALFSGVRCLKTLEHYPGG